MTQKIKIENAQARGNGFGPGDLLGVFKETAQATSGAIDNVGTPFREGAEVYAVELRKYTVDSSNQIDFDNSDEPYGLMVLGSYEDRKDA